MLYLGSSARPGGGYPKPPPVDWQPVTVRIETKRRIRTIGQVLDFRGALPCVPPTVYGHSTSEPMGIDCISTNQESESADRPS